MTTVPPTQHHHTGLTHSHADTAPPADPPEQTRTAFATTQPCVLVATHVPTPLMTEYHHTKPVYLQNRLYGHVQFGPDLWVCSNCHDSIHAWIYYLMGEHQRPPGSTHTAAYRAARATVDWFNAEKARIAAQQPTT